MGIVHMEEQYWSQVVMLSGETKRVGPHRPLVYSAVVFFIGILL